jgi:5-methylcytosine-specific restriction enzyme B
MSKDFLDRTKENTTSTIPTQNILVLFFNELRKCGAEFGYRSASEINRLIAVLDTLTKDNRKWDEKDISNYDFIDIAIMQKLLPKLHGSRNKLTRILPVLGALCLVDEEKIKENYFEKIDLINYLEDGNIKYKLSFEKICRMYKNAIENGYASYAEA